MKEDYQKAFKKSTLCFPLNPIPFNGQCYQKQKAPGTSDQSLFRLRTILLLVIYYLTKSDNIFDQVIPKTASANLCKSVYDIINYSTSICPFESGKCGKEGKKLQKFEYLENEKSFLDEIKKHFIVFKGLSFGKKIKN